MKHSKTALCMLLLLTVFLAGCGNDSPADPQPIAQGQPAAREQTGSLKEQYDSAMVLMVNEQWSRAAEMFSALSG